jgi:hypothetical protein
MSTPYERKMLFRHHLLKSFRNGDPEALDALLESPNPFGHFNFRYHHNVSLTEAIAEAAAANELCDRLVLLNMYKKLLERGLDSAERPLMLAYFAFAPISVELMEFFVPSQERIKNTAEALWEAWYAVTGRMLICAQGRAPVDVHRLNITKENMRVFKNLPTVREYLETVFGNDLWRQQKEKENVCRLIDEVLTYTCRDTMY